MFECLFFFQSRSSPLNTSSQHTSLSSPLGSLPGEVDGERPVSFHGPAVDRYNSPSPSQRVSVLKLYLTMFVHSTLFSFIVLSHLYYCFSFFLLNLISFFMHPIQFHNTQITTRKYIESIKMLLKCSPNKMLRYVKVKTNDT